MTFRAKVVLKRGARVSNSVIVFVGAFKFKKLSTNHNFMSATQSCKTPRQVGVGVIMHPNTGGKLSFMCCKLADKTD